MAFDLDFSPPEVPENLLWYGAIFQLICVLVIIVPVSKSHKVEAEPFEPRSEEVMRKTKVVAPCITRNLRRRPRRSGRRQGWWSQAKEARALGAALLGLSVLSSHSVPGPGSEVAGMPSHHRALNNHNNPRPQLGTPPFLLLLLL